MALLTGARQSNADSATLHTHLAEKGSSDRVVQLADKVMADHDSVMPLTSDLLRQYNGDTLSKLNQTQSVTYLNDQYATVSRVRDQMKRSMADANAYL